MIKSQKLFSVRKTHRWWLTTGVPIFSTQYTKNKHYKAYSKKPLRHTIKRWVKKWATNKLQFSKNSIIAREIKAFMPIFECFSYFCFLKNSRRCLWWSIFIKMYNYFTIFERVVRALRSYWSSFCDYSFLTPETTQRGSRQFL